jgi:dTDP-4-amino-4,6-dideoxygalactose transaminase
MDDTLTVPFLDLKAQYPQIRSEIEDKIEQIISNSAFILGPHVEQFERDFAAAHDAKYCIGVSSGTDALHVALEALEIGRGDDVLVPVNTFIATAEAVSLVGARPIFVDCNEYYNIDVDQVRERLVEDRKRGKPRIKAIIPVHLYGQPADMDQLGKIADEFGVFVVEDAAQAHLATWGGKKIGGFGSLAAFSFYPGKNLGAFGEAGAVLTNSDDLYERAKMYRQHGEIERYKHSIVGHNYRMEAIQGAVLGTKLKYLPEWTEKRQRNAALYDQLLGNIEGVRTPPIADKAKSAYHLYVIQHDRRDELRQFLDQNNVASGLHYPVPLHQQPAYASDEQPGQFPVAEAAASRILSLPMYPELSEGHIQRVCDLIGQFTK